MSKRRKKSSQPNLPEETLARARREAGLEAAEPEAEAETEVQASDALAANDTAAPVESAPPPQQETLPPIQRRKRRREINPEEMTHEEIAELLTHPTREVSLEELKTQYAYVMTDLRNMGALAALFFVVMIVAAQFL